MITLVQFQLIGTIAITECALCANLLTPIHAVALVAKYVVPLNLKL